WHNQFRLQVTNKINEELFKPLFSAENGAPAAPIRVLVGMMILKEGRGISDEQLFESVRFNMLARSALGLLNIDYEPPVESTYYLLRRRIAEYEKKGGENLPDRMFKELTKEQSIEFGVSGKQIRMDSKLLGSNIARYGR
ncbi:MAG: transposase, partial [Treponema sp.]|nr:transposase [Treponema sp.]